jgi:hypothetical protein
MVRLVSDELESVSPRYAKYPTIEREDIATVVRETRQEVGV